MDGRRRTDIWITKSLPELSSGETKRYNIVILRVLCVLLKEKHIIFS